VGKLFDARSRRLLSSCVNVVCWFAEKRPENLLTEDDIYDLRQTGHVVYSRGYPAAVCSMTSLPVVFLVTVCRHVTQ